MKTSFVPSPSGALNKKTAVIVGRELLAIQKQYGVIQPQSVVKAASNSRSPLHRYFCWDDTEAAKNYREWQARQLISSVHVIVVGDESKPAVRAFVNVAPTEDEDIGMPDRGYMSTASITGRKSYESQVLQFAHDQLLRWRKKFGELEAFFGVVRAIDAIPKKLRKAA